MANQNKFEGIPILCWTIDDFQQLRQAVDNTAPSGFSLDDYVERYRRDVFQTKIDVLFSGTSIKLNLGGKSEKSRITATERPLGVFDFSLASKGLYKIQEYYSEKLANEYPDKFAGYELPSGVVPVNYVRDEISNGVKVYFYEDGDGYFPCIKQQKGTAAKEQGVVGAKLDFATKTKKVYLTFKKNRGKVKYVEIYSLFYYATPQGYSLEGNTQFAIRHIPAIMVAEYLESMGIMTRIYMTRFVELSQNRYYLNQYYQGSELPMYDLAGAGQMFRNELFIQPIIVKEFGQELDKSFAFMISSQTFDDVYEYIATYAQTQEVDTSQSDLQLYGQPNFMQEEYFVGIERYRNKYKSYVDLGIFKSKEVLPEAMLFFHDEVIALRLRRFCDEIESLLDTYKSSANYTELHEMLADTEINPFFSWWMKLSANNLKDKINIINSNELQKDIYLIRTDLEKIISDLNKLINDISISQIKNYLRLEGANILYGYKIFDNQGKMTFRNYITAITNEITTYADGGLYATEVETREKRDELVRDVLTIVSSILD